MTIKKSATVAIWQSPPREFWANELEFDSARAEQAIVAEGAIGRWIDDLTGQQVRMLCTLLGLPDDDSVQKLRTLLHERAGGLLPFFLVAQFGKGKAEVAVVEVARDAADNRTNLYVLALANSGAGKNEPRKVNQRICVEVGPQDCLGDAFASGEGIEDRLFVTPSVLFQTDEIDGLMNTINKASDARHEGIMNVLLKMYTSSSTIHPMRVKAGGQSPGVIDQPSLCMLGTAVPKYYYEAINVRMLNNGFFARLIILEAGKRGRGQMPVARPIPKAILETARWWADYRPGTGNLQDWHPTPVCVEATPEADASMEQCRAYADDRYAEAEERDDPAGMAIWARAYEKARKLALIYAVSANHLQPRIDERAVRWAWRFVDYQTRRMLFMADQHVAEGEFDAKCKRMLEVLTSWRQRRGDAWMPHWELSRRLKWSDKDIEEVRSALRGQRRIEHDVSSTAGGGPVAQRYRLLVPNGGGQLPQVTT